jgi:hypothetical protein
MSQKSPQAILRRVLLVSRIDGWSIVIVAGLCALVSLAFGDLTGTLVGLLVAGGGATEIGGRRRLIRHDADGGMDWLVRSQLIVLGVIWAYAGTRLGSFDAESALANLTPDMKAMLDQAGVDTKTLLHYVRLFFYAIYGTVMAVTLLYQGGLALYYRNRREAVRQALTAVPAVPAAS